MKLSGLLGELPIPSVLVDSCQPDDKQPLFNEVNFDSTAATKEAVESLLHLGHRDIALIRHQSDSELHHHRRRSYEAALRAHGLKVRADRIFKMIPMGETAYATVKGLYQKKNPPTAFVVAGSDELTVGAMTAIQQLGLRIPQDVSLISFGDTILFSVPPLSTVRIPWEELGERAVRMLKDRFKDPTAPLQRELLPCEFISRGSCDTPSEMNLKFTSARV